MTCPDFSKHPFASGETIYTIPAVRKVNLVSIAELNSTQLRINETLVAYWQPALVELSIRMKAF